MPKMTPLTLTFGLTLTLFMASSFVGVVGLGNLENFEVTTPPRLAWILSAHLQEWSWLISNRHRRYGPWMNNAASLPSAVVWPCLWPGWSPGGSSALGVVFCHPLRRFGCSSGP